MFYFEMIPFVLIIVTYFQDRLWSCCERPRGVIKHDSVTYLLRKGCIGKDKLSPVKFVAKTEISSSRLAKIGLLSFSSITLMTTRVTEDWGGLPRSDIFTWGNGEIRTSLLCGRACLDAMYTKAPRQN